jgi:tetratricopeptide (TPR) repeat protein
MFNKIALFVCLLSSVLHAQRFGFEGRIEGEAGIPMDRLRVVATSVTNRDAHQAWPRTDGTFNFLYLPPGAYEFSLLSANGDVLAREAATVPGSMGVTLKLPASAAPPVPVSLYRLTHEVPSGAAKAFRKASGASKKARHREAMLLLDEAIHADPDFVDALYRRGQYALSGGDLEQARRLLGKAADLDPSWPALQTDAAVAEYAAKGFDACERRAAAALRLDPANAKPNFLRGLALLQLGKPARQAVPYLERAASEFPKAAEILGQIRRAGETPVVMK